MSLTGTIDLMRCRSCHARFLPGDGPCPKCGSPDCLSYPTSAVGKVMAATELHYPASGWHTPHRLALVEMADSVRLFAIVEGTLPISGALVEVRLEKDVYRAKAEPAQ